MRITLGANIWSLQTQNQILKTGRDLEQVYKRLSSGLRINTASDDPTGLMMSANLSNDQAKTVVAIRNANDGISLASSADAGLAEIEAILMRMSELANESANSIYTYADRAPLQVEYQALGSEIERIATDTLFNGVALLKNATSKSIQVGVDSSASSQITIQAASGDLNSLGIGTSGGAYTTYIDQEAAATTAVSAIDTALERIALQRGLMGSAMSRLSFTVNYLGRKRDSLANAISSIRDADLAADSAELVRLQVLQQSQSAVLGQANQQPALALRLLG